MDEKGFIFQKNVYILQTISFWSLMLSTFVIFCAQKTHILSSKGFVEVTWTVDHHTMPRTKCTYFQCKYAIKFAISKHLCLNNVLSFQLFHTD